MHGCSPLQQVMRVQGLRRPKNADAIAGVYVATLDVFFAMYYGLHAAEYGTAPELPRSVVVRR